MEATHKISACYFPKSGQVELTWEDLKTGKVAFLTTSVSPNEGNQIARVISPCLYYGAVLKQQEKRQDKE